MRSTAIIPGILICIGLIRCSQPAFPDSTSEPNQISLSVDSLLQVRNWPTDTVIVTFDHPRKQNSQYEGVAFQPILQYLIDQYQLTEEVMFTFICKDGYIASNSLQTLLDAEGGYIVWADLKNDNSTQWSDSLQHFAPYYLTWDSIPYDDHSVVWPYGWTELRIRFDDPYRSLIPTEKRLVQGFELYKRHCIKCHSLNGLGGDLGPEFNIPMNITEYWKRNMILKYVKNPSAVRLHSKMYPISSLDDSDINLVIDYLEYIRDYKKEWK